MYKSVFKRKFYSSLLTMALSLSAFYPSATFASGTALATEIINTEEQAISAEKKLELNKPTIEIIEIAPGLTEKIYKVLRKDGPVTAYFLEADKNDYRLLPALDKDKIPGRETVSEIAAEHGAIAAVNASYFSIKGEILGVTKIDGKIVGATEFERTALGISADGALRIGKVSYQGYVTLNGVTLPVSGVDSECGENGVVIYNSFYGDSTNTNEYVMAYVIQNNKVVAINRGNTAIPAGGFVVCVHGTSIDAFKDIMVGDTADVFENIGEPWNNDVYVLGVGPRLVEEGKVNVTAVAEEFPKDIRVGRNPRAGFGITREGNYLFAVVDGRQPKHSIGATLTEFAQMFTDMGAINAMNFDGGASATLVVNGKVVNYPSAGKERNIGDALLLMAK